MGARSSGLVFLFAPVRLIAGMFDYTHPLRTAPRQPSSASAGQTTKWYARDPGMGDFRRWVSPNTW